MKWSLREKLVLAAAERKRQRWDQNKQKVLERRTDNKKKNIKDDVKDLNLLSDLFKALLINDHSLWSYSKALAGREIHPSCAAVALIDERSAESPVRSPFITRKEDMNDAFSSRYIKKKHFHSLRRSSGAATVLRPKLPTTPPATL